MSATCFVCDRPATLAPTTGVDFCERCARRVAFLALRAVPVIQDEIWCLTAPPGVGQLEAPPRPEKQGEFERVFAEFKGGVQKAVDSDDPQALLDLAVVYCEMGLHADALREAAVAALASSPREPNLAAALKVLLTAPLLRPGGLGALRRRLVVLDSRRMN